MLALGLCLAALIQTSFISPNSESIWYPSQTYDIEWSNRGIVHLQLELHENNTWSSHLVPDEEFHFLSVISDHDIGSYSWTIPSYLSEFWKLEKRIKMTDLTTNTINYSENFTIVGLSVNDLNSMIYATSIVNITWNSNSDSSDYNVYLLPQSTNYYNYLVEGPIDVISNNLNKTSCQWQVPLEIDGNYKIGVSTANNLTWAISNQFTIDTLTSSPTSTPTTSPSTTPTITPTITPTTTPTSSPTTSPSSSPTSTPTFGPVQMCLNKFCVIDPDSTLSVWCNLQFYPSMCYAYCNNISSLINCTSSNYTDSFNNISEIDITTLQPTISPSVNPTWSPTILPTTLSEAIADINTTPFCQQCTNTSSDGNDKSVEWYIWLIIALSILVLLIILCILVYKYGKKDCKVSPCLDSPSPTPQPTPRRECNNYNNPVYDDSGLERDPRTLAINNPVYESSSPTNSYERRTGTWTQNVMYQSASVDAGVDFIRTGRATYTSSSDNC